MEEPPDAPPVLGPPIEPLPLGDEVEPLECGAALLPDELAGPQSFIAVVLLLSLLSVALAPLLLELGLVVPLAPALLEPGLLAAELLLPGAQSLLDMLPDVPDEVPDVVPLVPALVPEVVPLVPALVSDLPVAPPVVLLVCAMAAVPRVSAMIEAAVRRRRFIRCPPCEKSRSAGREALGTLDR